MSGRVPDYTTQEGQKLFRKDIGWQALGPATALSIITTLVVAARWYTRCYLVRCLGLDDFAILLSLPCILAHTSLIAALVAEGIGNYNPSVDSADIAILLLASNNIHTLAVTVTKASILLQYLRLFKSARPILILTYILLFLLLPSLLWGVLGSTLLCTPVRKIWEPSVTGTCRSGTAYWLSSCAINIVLDLCVLLLPLPAVLALRLPRRQKWSLVLVFTLGFATCGVSVMRLVLVYVTGERGNKVQSSIWAVVWSSVEANVGVVCASALALKPLVAKVWPGLGEEGEHRVPRHCMRLNTVPESEMVERSSNSVTLVTPSRGEVGSKGTIEMPAVVARE